MAKYSNIEKLLQKVNKDLHDVKKEFYKGLVDVLVEASYDATDTGAYMDSHAVGTDTRSVGYTSKEGDHKARFVAKGPVAERAKARMYSQIDALPDDATKVYISNRSPHSKFVEEGGWRWLRSGYMPFRAMRSKAKIVLAGVVAEVKGRSS